MEFNLIKTDVFSKARVGLIQTDHGKIKTPVFIPIASKGYIKSILMQNFSDISIILGNAYHLSIQPGMKVIKKIGGIHSFMNWNKPILTDSGGYQIFSLKKLNKVTEHGVIFRSILDGSSHLFSPDKSMKIQRIIGGDIIMSFDDCPSFPCSYLETKQSLKRTLFWLKQCIYFLKKNPEIYNHKQYFFPIIHGSIYPDLRKHSVEETMNFVEEVDGYAIGGLSIGEKKEKTYSITDLLTNIIPKKNPRYLMGVGSPKDILENIELGIDMFDCVIPTRNGRHGMLFTWNGIVNIKNRKWKYDYSCLDEGGTSPVDQLYSKSYVRHLFLSKENLGKEVASIHNLYFYFNLVKQARDHILQNNFVSWKRSVISSLTKRL
ncbi:tRNA guanosine(34) transglycosylase Tgt [Blattabacterium cuenoti]|uniref:tRNA guanosine(34) transglycosylase Tgt n=1 Tax=Blattabacterium cuenoti TaxID=1653831 RepID=UPI00163BEA1D|nr:tRNA guanosine(34) transglycosylase Tgt [Blattabacterium cuenoti]